MTTPLIVVALRSEAAHLRGHDVVLTGIGKVSAAVAVTRAIAARRPSFVLNVGTAGALRDGLEGAHRIGRVGLAERAHLVDMEGFAVARACAAAGVVCRMVKVVSDTASDDAARSWKAEADRTARLIAAVVTEHA